MYFLRDPLTQYCIEGAFELGHLSPLAFTIGAYLPERYHAGISLFDLSAASEFPDFENIESTFLNVARGLDRSALAYLRNPLIDAIGHYVEFRSETLSSDLVNKGIESIPEYKVDTDKLKLRSILSNRFEEKVAHINNPLDAIHPTNVARHIQPTLVKDEQMFNLCRDILALPENQCAADKYERMLLSTTSTQLMSIRTCDLKKPRRKRQRIKKAVARAARLFSMLPTGNKTLSAFLSGEATVVSGSVFDYKICKNYSLHEDVVNFDHIPYRLEVLDKNSHIVLTELCVVFKGQPMLDQVFSLLMYIQAGEESERELLQTANALNTADEAYLNDDYVRHFGAKPRSVLTREQLDAASDISRFQIIRNTMNLVNQELIAETFYDSFNSESLDRRKLNLRDKHDAKRERLRLGANNPIFELAGGTHFFNAMSASQKARLTIKETTK